jgi:N-acetylneuraminate synthase
MQRLDTTLDLELCRPTEEHARQVMAWRNDPETLSASFHREPKQWEGFWPEFRDGYFVDPGLPPLFVLARGDRVGFLRFRAMAHPAGLSGRVVDISLMIAPEQRGHGLGRRSLSVATGFLRDTLGVDSVVAEIRVDNRASVACFEAAGFVQHDVAEKLVAETGERCSVRRLTCELIEPFWRRHHVFVIAEAGSNWRMGTPERDLAMGKALIDVAKEAGADAVKFQTYRAETVYVENAGTSSYLTAAGHDQSIRQIFADLAMSDELIESFASHCKGRGIAFMSTPFSPRDFAAVDPHVEIHKIASYEISHPHLLALAGGSSKPLVLSTGACRASDIDWAVNAYRQAGGRNLCLMQCTAKYPAAADSLNLRVIPWIRRRFGVAAGFSDHSRHPLHGPLAAVALGARVIEKHFTIDNRLPGPDHAFAVTPGELTGMVSSIREVELTLGSGIKDVLPAEQELATYARRGLQASRAIRRGEPLREGDNLEILRPGNQPLGLHPRHLAELEGKAAARDIALGEGIRQGDWIA